MTSYASKGELRPGVEFLAFDHLHFWVGNAFQAAAYYCTRFGFSPLAFKGLETGSRQITTQVIKQNNIIFAFSSPLEPGNDQFANHLSKHGDGVRDVAFAVRDCAAVFKSAVDAGAAPVSAPKTITDADGTCVTATIAGAYPDLTHTFVERSAYTGVFLPGYQRAPDADPQMTLSGPTGLNFIDHCVSNQPDSMMEPVVDWYCTVLGFHRFWSVDDKQLHTKYSSLRSVVVADFHERVKMPINEPAAGLRKSQIQEFVEYYGGPGIQHIALNTGDIVEAVGRLRRRGVAFIKVPDTYYDDLRKRLRGSATNVREDMDRLQQLGILVDFDEGGYLLQIFTKPVQDRPTLFLEVIQRRKHEGFGVGNFKSLFEAIEREQALRGNL